MSKIIAWFSCGATSAVACKIALSLYDDVHIYYIETGSGHPDNTRFLADCEKWYNQSIHIIRSDKYTCVSDVLRKGYINGAHGAACTLELKKKVRYKLEKDNPDKKFYFTETEPVCMDMKLITLEKVLHVLKTGENEVHLSEELRTDSRKPLEKMLELAK